MAIVTPPKSKLAAHEAAISSYLQTELGFSFEWTGGVTSVDDGPKGRIIVNKEYNKEQFILTILDRECRLILSIYLAGTDPVELRRTLLDWAEVLEAKIAVLTDQGLTGTYREVALDRAFKGLRQISDHEILSRTEDQGTGDDTVTIGWLTTTYRFNIETLDY